MKRIPLAGPAVRGFCLAVDVILAALAALWLTRAFSWLVAAVAAVAALILGLYTVLVFRAAILVDPENGTAALRGIQNQRLDLSGARRVYTRAAVVGSQSTRMVVAEGADGRELAVIPTLNGSSERACERTAQRLAEALGARFRPSLPEKDGKTAPGPVPEPEPEPGPVNYDEQDDEET